MSTSDHHSVTVLLTNRTLVEPKGLSGQGSTTPVEPQPRSPYSTGIHGGSHPDRPHPAPRGRRDNDERHIRRYGRRYTPPGHSRRQPSAPATNYRRWFIEIPGGRATSRGWLGPPGSRPALLASLSLAADLGLDRHVGHVARALSFFLHRRGRWHDRAETQRAAVAAARRQGDSGEESRALRNLAWALADLGRFDDAHRNLDAALERSDDDPAGRAWTHYYRDLVYAIQGREADALDAARRAHDLFDQLGDQVGQAIALTDLGWHHGRLGGHGQALDLCERALVLHQKLGNRAHEAHTWSCLAEIHLQVAADPARALRCYRQALTCSGSSATCTPRPAPSRTSAPATTSPATTRPPTSSGATPTPYSATSTPPRSIRSTPS